MDTRLRDPAWRLAFEQAGDSACADWLEERRAEHPAALDAAPTAERLVARDHGVEAAGEQGHVQIAANPEREVDVEVD